jgi:hypothetical protein
MVAWAADTCGHCGRELPRKGYALRRVPRRGGRRLRVHTECAKEIDRQGTLEEVGAPDPREGRVPY